MIKVPLGGKLGGVALIDDADYPLVSPYHWYAHQSGQVVYACRTWREDGRSRTQYMHNLITGIIGIDHEDHDGRNNQRFNLRPASQGPNSQNRRKSAGCSSQYKGVSWDKQHGRWHAHIRVDGKMRFLGLFSDEAEAARAYDTAARAAWPAFASFNFSSERGTA